MPSVLASVAPGPGVPFGALVHPWLPGRAMDEGDAVRHPQLPHQIAGALATLHRAPADRFPAGSLVDVDPIDQLERWIDQSRAVIDARLSPSERRMLERLRDEAAAILPGRDRVVSHGDPWYGNMLVDANGSLTALLDFGEACLADPAYDLAAQTYLDPPSAEQTIEAYLEQMGPLVDLRRRLQGYLLIRELWGLAYGVRNALEDEIEHAFASLVGLLD